MQALKSFTSGGADTSSNKQGGGDMQSKVRFSSVPYPPTLRPLLSSPLKKPFAQEADKCD